MVGNNTPTGEVTICGPEGDEHICTMDGNEDNQANGNLIAATPLPPTPAAFAPPPAPPDDIIVGFDISIPLAPSVPDVPPGTV